MQTGTKLRRMLGGGRAQVTRTINVYFIAHAFPLDGDPLGWGGELRVYIRPFNGQWKWRTLAHELGHAMGLSHDFRENSEGISGAYIMGNFVVGNDNRKEISPGAAEWLRRHRVFNSEPMTDYANPIVIDLVFISQDKDSVRFKMQATPGGAYEHAVLLSSHETYYFLHWGFPEVIAFTSVPAPEQVERGVDEYSLDFGVTAMDAERLDTSQMWVKLIGKYGQITEVPYDGKGSD